MSAADGIPGPGLFPRSLPRQANCNVRAAFRLLRQVAQDQPARRAGHSRLRTAPPFARGRTTDHLFSRYQHEHSKNSHRWNASAADARPGPPGVVRKPPAAAVCPFSGIRRPAPKPGPVPGGRPRARPGRVSTKSTIKARAVSMPARATLDVEGPLLTRGAAVLTLLRGKRISQGTAMPTSASHGTQRTMMEPTPTNLETTATTRGNRSSLATHVIMILLRRTCGSRGPTCKSGVRDAEFFPGFGVRSVEHLGRQATTSALATDSVAS
jgi:hypothetical protein